MTKICLPHLGENVSKATVSYWYCKAGEAVVQGSDLVEMTTDKAAFNVPAPCDGVLSEIVAREGDEVGVGDVLAVIDESRK